MAAATNPYPPNTPNHTFWNMMHLTKGPGSDAALKEASQEFGIDFNNHNAGFQIARYLLPTLYPSLLQQQLFANSLQPMQQSAASQALALLSNPDMAAGQYRSKVNAQAGSTLQNVLQRLKSSGAGIGATQGAALNSANQANAAGNMFQAQQDSPQGQMNRYNAMMATIFGQQPNLSTMGNLNSITQQTPRGQSGLGQVLGAVSGLGQMAGGFNFGSLLGGGGGSGYGPFANANEFNTASQHYGSPFNYGSY